MKKTLFLLTLFIPTFLFSQEIDSEIQKLSNKVVPDFCGCLQEYDALEFQEKFGNCFGANLQKYEDEMNQYFSNDTTAIAREKNNKFIQDLLMGMQAKLFNECPVYYNFIDNMKVSAIRKLRESDTDKKLDSLNNLSNPVKDYSYYYMKASMLFANKNYEKAKEQISNGLALNVDNDKLNILLAWIFEEQNELESAINIYDEMYSKTGRVETMLFREFTKSKMSDRILPEKDCSQFKTGKFKMSRKNGNKLVFIERNEKMQIETSPEDNSVTKMNIEWIDECNYILKYTESTNKDMDEYIGKELKVTILETSNNSMRFKATMEGVEYVMIDEMQKIDN